VDSQCQAFQLAIDVLGRPWNALILNVLLDAPLRFNALKRRAQGPGDRILSARLKDLEAS
jgi:DNA-binding HxlR family transcriptional regulator